MKTTNSVMAILIIASAAIISSCGNQEQQKTEAIDTTKISEQAAAPTYPSEHNDAAETHEVNKTGGGPHQGMVQEAGEGYHMEMVMSGKDLIFYPLDARTEPVEMKGWSGKALMQYADGDTKNIDMKMMDNMLIAMGANTGEKFKSVVTLTNGSTSISSQFSSEADEHGGESHDHTH
ncbi:MAG: hypothetical protein ABIQ74_13805 [Chitinophagales bacterium]